MAIKIKELIKKLGEKDQNAEVEFVVVKTNGNMVCMDIKSNAHDMTKLLNMFSQ